jgi:cyclopropane fatty-acyl-phospholipid synthase-like methyltransferase
VLTEGGADLDALIAFNFSYWVFKTREQLGSYFKFAREQLAEDGILFLDCFGGYEAQREMSERRDIDESEDFEYIWDQAEFNPVTHDYTCHIHFRFPDGSRMDEAFTYHWRLWAIPELRDLLTEAGFSRTLVYWQGWDEDEEEGSDEYEVVENGDADPGWVCYIVALV